MNSTTETAKLVNISFKKLLVGQIKVTFLALNESHLYPAVRKKSLGQQSSNFGGSQTNQINKRTTALWKVWQLNCLLYLDNCIRRTVANPTKCLLHLCPVGDSNPCFGLERAASWAARRTGPNALAILANGHNPVKHSPTACPLEQAASDLLDNE